MLNSRDFSKNSTLSKKASLERCEEPPAQRGAFLFGAGGMHGGLPREEGLIFRGRASKGEEVFFGGETSFWKRVFIDEKRARPSGLRPGGTWGAGGWWTQARGGVLEGWGREQARKKRLIFSV